jgi:hypothetical protein
MPRGRGRGARSKNEGNSSKRGGSNHRHGQRSCETDDSDVVHRLQNVELENGSNSDSNNSSSGAKTVTFVFNHEL